MYRCIRLSSVLAMSALLVGGCGYRGLWQAQSEHYVEGELVSSEPVHPRAYECYVRARIALETSPPDLASARLELRAALDYDSNDAHLWTTLAEIEEAAGDLDAAAQWVGQALQLAPQYPPALALEARLSSGNDGVATATARSPTTNPG